MSDYSDDVRRWDCGCPVCGFKYVVYESHRNRDKAGGDYKANYCPNCGNEYE
jgi:hypothetical protein